VLLCVGVRALHHPRSRRTPCVVLLLSCGQQRLILQPDRSYATEFSRDLVGLTNPAPVGGRHVGRGQRAGTAAVAQRRWCAVA
jgi:hypothetical protein